MSDVEWGFAQGSRPRHAFRQPRGRPRDGFSSDEATRSLMPQSLCGTTFAAKWPPARPDGWYALPCRSCERLYKLHLERQERAA